MKVKDAMTKSVITVSPEDPLEKIIDTLSEGNISGTPVVEGRKLVGVISESDILRKIGLKKLVLPESGDTKKIKKKIAAFNAEKIMKKNAYFVKEDDDIEKAIKLMNQKDVNRLPVLDAKDELVGILTRGDVIRVFSKSLGVSLLTEKKEPIILETDIDKVLKIIGEKGSIRIDELAKNLNVSEEKIEEWIEILEEHNLVTLEYPPFGKPFVKIIKK